ncbi:MAG: hypothetical protein IT583_06275 [Verrucomicrobia bacterium]|nr:hypothetical protein [Verrucomicrobiota bacterium]
MSKIEYSKDLCAKLFEAANDPALKTGHRLTRHEAGDELTVRIQGVSPAVYGSAVLLIEEFLGGGSSGQSYRCRLTSLNLPAARRIDGLEPGRLYTVRIMLPPDAFTVWLRDTAFRLAFQGPFSAQVNYSACRAGLIFQKLVRRAAKLKFGCETAVADVYASFYDTRLNSYGEITEWVEGRMWQLEADIDFKGRRHWKTIPLNEAGSPEYIAKRRFMSGMVELLYEMGAAELARQYEWWTMRSQTNVLKRTDLQNANGPDEGLCAVNFRAGIALLPWLPTSPGDLKLIYDGIINRGTSVQFDRIDIAKMQNFIEAHESLFAGMMLSIDEFFEQDRAYRRSLPDMAHHGSLLLSEAELRNDVRAGLIEGYLAAELIDLAFAAKLQHGGLRFASFYLLGALPILGNRIRKRWGHTAWREHFTEIRNSKEYRNAARRADAANHLIVWHRAGRVDEKHIDFLLKIPALFTLERFTLRLLPLTLHRAVLRPTLIARKLRNQCVFLKNFITGASFRKQWLSDKVHMWQHGELARKVPVFGKPGALLEHLIFDITFNLAHWLNKKAKPMMTKIRQGFSAVWGRKKFPVSAHTLLSAAQFKKNTRNAPNKKS